MSRRDSPLREELELRELLWDAERVAGCLRSIAEALDGGVHHKLFDAWVRGRIAGLVRPDLPLDEAFAAAREYLDHVKLRAGPPDRAVVNGGPGWHLAALSRWLARLWG